MGQRRQADHFPQRIPRHQPLGKRSMSMEQERTDRVDNSPRRQFPWHGPAPAWGWQWTGAGPMCRDPGRSGGGSRRALHRRSERRSQPREGESGRRRSSEADTVSREKCVASEAAAAAVKKG